MSALGSLVVKLALDYAEYTQGLDRSSQDALKFAKNAQGTFDQASRSSKEFLANVAGNVAGAITSVIGLNAAFTGVRDSINVLESLDDAAQKTGSSVEDLSRIAKVAKNFGDAFQPIEQGITRLAKGLAQIDNPSSDAIRALDAIGVSARDSNGQLRTAADVYIDVAKSLQQYKDGAEKTAVATALFGKSGAELLPMLNNLAQGIDDVKATSAASAQQASMFNDAVAKSKATVNGLFMSLAVDLLPTLNNIAGAVNQSAGQIGGFSIASESAKVVLKGLAIAAYTVVDTFQGMGREIGARSAQLAALSQLDFKGAKFIGQALAEDNAKSRAAYDKFVDTVLNGEKKISAAVDVGEKKLINYQLQIPPAVDSATRSIEKQAKAFDMELHKLKEYDKEASRARDITQSVATKQEIYNQTLDELNRLRPYLSIETYNRALEKAQKALDDTGDKNRTVVNEMDQLWMQAGRNIQSTLANSIFDFFSGGLDDMWRNAKVAVGRILSEFAALKLAQSVGLTAMFAVPGSASASASAAGSGGGVSVLDAANLGTGALNLFKGGFGATSLIGSGLSKLGGFVGSSGLSAFGAGFAGDAIGGLAAGGFTSGAASMASMGASFASFAGPAIAIAAVDQITRMLAGDKLIGGGVGKVLNYVPVLGPLLNGLFGRGPLKQKETSLIGEIGATGFESGMLQARFKASGNVFRGSKTDFARVDAMTGEIWTDNNKLLDFAKDLSKAGKELFGLINDTTKQTSSSLRQIGQDLGVSTAGIDNFKHSINLLSEKGKTLTDEQIGEEIQKITDGLAHSLLPQVDELAKRGETALQTVSRLGTEFTSLVDAATIVLGKSAADARAMILGSTFEGRTGFVDAAGGADALMQKTQTFAANFLTDAERMAPVQEQLNEQLGKLGLSTDLTKDQFRGLVQSFGQVNGITEETLQSLLNLMPAFLAVTNYTDGLTQSTQDLAAALAKSTQDMAAIEMARLQGVNATQAGMEIELMRLMGNESGALTKARLDELQTIDASLIPLQLAINQQQDLNTARAREAAITNERYGLETQILQLQGNTTELRQRELDALDPLNRASLQYIFALEDEKILKENAIKQMDTAFGALQRSVDAERKSVSKHIEDITKSINKLKDLSGSLRSTLDRMQISGNQAVDRQAAQAQISAALAIAKASGTLPEAESLRRALDVVAQPSEDLFGSFVDYMRDFARTAADINSLDGLTQSQIGIEDQALRLAESQMSALDGILSTAQAQLDAINGVDNSIQSLASALQGFEAAKSAVAAAGGAGSSTAAIAAANNIQPLPPPLPTAITAPVILPAPVGILGGAGNPAYSGRDIVSFLTSGVTPEQGLAKALETGVSARQIETAFAGQQGYTLSNIRNFVTSKGLVPGFVDGGLHAGGLRIVGERGPELEFTGPSRIFNNSDSKRLLDLSEVVAELKALREEMAEIKTNTGSTATHTQKTADLLDDVSAGGGPILVSQVL